MDYDETIINTFLQELYDRTGGDPERQVGMQEVGEALGLEQSRVGSLAEELLMEGLVELKTLSGAIGITAEALERLRQLGLAGGGGGGGRSLSGDPVLSAADREVVEEVLGELKSLLGRAGPDWAMLEEAVIDIKTIEVQLLSARPKAAVVLALFASFREMLGAARLEASAPLLFGLTGGQS